MQKSRVIDAAFFRGMPGSSPKDPAGFNWKDSSRRRLTHFAMRLPHPALGLGRTALSCSLIPSFRYPQQAYGSEPSINAVITRYSKKHETAVQQILPDQNTKRSCDLAAFSPLKKRYPCLNERKIFHKQTTAKNAAPKYKRRSTTAINISRIDITYSTFGLGDNTAFAGSATAADAALFNTPAAAGRVTV